MSTTENRTSIPLRVLILISRVFVGLVFTFSGFVKAVDPLGSTYKFTDYFIAFGIPSFSAIALPMAFVLSGLELLVGIALLLNFKSRTAALGALLFMIVFTPLTLYLALKNPVHDCGCFGDAVILTNWQTFWKNVLILVFVVLLFVVRRRLKSWFSPRIQVLLVSVFGILALAFQYYNLEHLPVQDYRPYKVGTHIPLMMQAPEKGKFLVDKHKSSVEVLSPDSKVSLSFSGDKLRFDFPVHSAFNIVITDTAGTRLLETRTEAGKYAVVDLSEVSIPLFIVEASVPLDKYVYEYTMKNTVSGEEKVIDSDTYISSNIWQDTTWTITGTSEPILKEKGYQAPIHDLDIFNQDSTALAPYPPKTNITQDILDREGFAVWVVAYNLTKSSEKGLLKAKTLAQWAAKNNVPVYCLTASGETEVEALRTKLNPGLEFFNCDDITLKTIVRANPGFVLLNKGTILAKWHHNDFPDTTGLSAVFEMKLTQVQSMKD